MKIRLANSNDQPGIIELISSVYTEYGEKMCLEKSDKDLLDIASYYFNKGGMFWVLADANTIFGTHAAHLSYGDPCVCTFRRLYLDASLRGTDWGRQLMQVTMDWARNQPDFRRIEFWSDTRFERAHHFFAKFGFERTSDIRTVTDGYEPYQEYFFRLEI